MARKIVWWNRRWEKVANWEEKGRYFAGKVNRTPLALVGHEVSLQIGS